MFTKKYSKLTVGKLRQLLSTHPDERVVIIDGLGMQVEFVAGYQGEVFDQEVRQEVFVLEVISIGE